MGGSFRCDWASNGNAASITEAARTNTFAGMFGDIIPPAAEGGDILRKVYGVGSKIISGTGGVAKGRVWERGANGRLGEKSAERKSCQRRFFVAATLRGLRARSRDP
ncbi:MAG TPA: hypothetical protein VHN10_12360, partial [Candidatus Acidoferrales bacterium]|nr:hypothetical protein [Candidatus Acidoferrales bacterium]